MKKYLIMFSVLLSGCVCRETYDQSDSDIRLKTEPFQMEVRINRYSHDEVDELDVFFMSKDNNRFRIIQGSLNIHPYFNFDTLQLSSQNAGHYYFELPEKSPEQINVEVLFDVDSSGVVIRKNLQYIGMKKKKNCDFSMKMH